MLEAARNFRWLLSQDIFQQLLTTVKAPTQDYPELLEIAEKCPVHKTLLGDVSIATELRSADGQAIT